jgi:hypothetical protein
MSCVTVFVMAGLVPAIHVFTPPQSKAWMPGTSPGMTVEKLVPAQLLDEGVISWS